METLYRTRDVRRRRAPVGEALAARAGERVLDVGCGPGFYVEELLEVVGPDGSVVGVDASPEMLAAAAARCARHANVAFHQGDATALPVDDASFDAALCVQVLEYVADATAALARCIERCVRAGASWCGTSTGRRSRWHSEDPARMERVLRALGRAPHAPVAAAHARGAAAGRRLLARRRRGPRLRHRRARPRGVRVGRRPAADRAASSPGGPPWAPRRRRRGPPSSASSASAASCSSPAPSSASPPSASPSPGAGLTRSWASSSCRARSGRTRSGPVRRSAAPGR